MFKTYINDKEKHLKHKNLIQTIKEGLGCNLLLTYS